MTKRAVRLSSLLLALAGPAAAQLISIKTVPIAQGDQFEIFPSNNLGMGSVSIALPDTLLDPFLNPAKGARLGAARLFGAPTTYGISPVAGSALWAKLTGVDGVDLLFAGNAGLKQFGHALDLRLGLLKEWPGERSLAALVLHNRFGMTDDVAYLDQVWNPATQQIAVRPRLEHNHDQTNTWGAHVEYVRPLAATGWRIGWLPTANRMSHPKLPEDELANVPAIPRDPGHSSAYNVGLGLSKTRGPLTFGIDAIYEPIWSYTWADAASPVVTATGDTIPVGGRTVENHFRFSDGLLRMGVSRDVPLGQLGKAAALQLGLMVRSVHYHLTQSDNLQAVGHALQEAWLEWTPTWGVRLRFPDLEIRYPGSVTRGTGRPGVTSPSGSFGVVDRALPLAGGRILR